MKIAIAILLGLFLTLTAPAQASERYAAFVADLDTGEVLHARRADAERYPASLTKLMTLYLMFEAIDAGEIALSTPMQASAEAASRPASHLGLSAGDTITVEQAIRALIVQSANDVAVVVAEHMHGAEHQFARAMTLKAFELGLTDTRFVNASGLPAARQVTTARDIARLAHAIRRDFEPYAHYFAERHFEWNGRTHFTHNTLVGSEPGVDGLKTGYIRASGFNVAVTAERDDRRLIAVVMGGVSAAVRDAHTRDLINAGFAALAARNDSVHMAALDLPRLNPVREQAIMTAELRNELRPSAMGSAPAQAPAQVTFQEPSLPLTTTWSVQFGAYSTPAAARARLETIDALLPETMDIPRNKEAQATWVSGRPLWRAQFTGLDSDQASTICQYLNARNETCIRVRPVSLTIPN